MYKDVIYDNNNIKDKDGSCIGVEFCMLLNLSRHQFKSQCHKFKILIVIPMVTSKKISKKYTQKEMRRESKWYTTKNQLETSLVAQ